MIGSRHGRKLSYSSAPPCTGMEGGAPRGSWNLGLCSAPNDSLCGLAMGCFIHRFSPLLVSREVSGWSSARTGEYGHFNTGSLLPCCLGVLEGFFGGRGRDAAEGTMEYGARSLFLYKAVRGFCICGPCPWKPGLHCRSPMQPLDVSVS